MDADRLSLVKQVFLRVVDLDEAERERELAACADPEVRREVRELLEHAPDGDADTLDRLLASRSASADAGANERTTSSELDSSHGRFVPGAMLGTRYRIVGLLGVGGMGEVYRADDLELGQAVALKFLPQELATHPAARERFRREVRLAREIAHANVCRVHDIAEQDGHVFLSMEFVDGDDLSQVLRRMGRPSPEKALDIAHQLCLGLAAAHERGVLHRDLKPANVLLDGRGRVRITDFGLAGLADELATSSERVGTPAYMAPEQLADGKATARSDLFSLGLVLHELFTGRRAFPGASVDEVLRVRASGTVSSTADLPPDVDPAVERVIDECVQLDPADRPSSVHAVLAALPGGDPLAAALAAGETPSPDLVASAGARGGLRPLHASLLMLAVVGLIALLVEANARLVRFPDVSGAVLATLAEAQLASLGFTELPAHDAQGFETNALFGVQALGGAAGEAGDGTAADRTIDRPAYRFWRRWSRHPLESEFPHGPGWILLDRPPRGLAGDVAVVLDADSGQLLELAAVPGDESRPGGAEPSSVDVSALFAGAGIDPARVAPIDEVPPVPPYCDAARAWRVTEPGRPELRATLGTSAGRLAWFRVDGVSEGEPLVELPPAWIGLSLLALQLGAAVLAVRNARTGRGDRRNALRFALLMGLAYIVMESLAALAQGTTLVKLFEELLWLRPAGHVLLHAFQAWVFYMAIEPHLRRARPQAMVGWIRWISGRGEDPAVGREVALGVLGGVLSACAVASVDWMASARGVAGASLLDGRGAMLLASTDKLLQQAITSFTAALLMTIYVSFFWLLLMLVFRRRAFLACLAICGAYLVLGPAVGLSILESSAHAVFALVWTLLFFRVGLLAALSMQIVTWSLSIPIGGRLDAWHAAWTVVPVGIVLGLAGVGCWVAAGGRGALRGWSGAVPHP